MLLSRLWFFALSLFVALGGAVASLVTQTAEEEQARHLAEMLRRDVIETRAALAVGARAQLDHLAGFAHQSAVRGPLMTVRSKGDDSRGAEARALAARQGLQASLRSLMRELDGSDEGMAFILDDAGRIVTQLGAGADGAPDRLTAVECVAKGLKGFSTHGVLVEGKKIYQTVVYPVMAEDTRVMGAVVYAGLLQAALTRQLSDALGGAGVGFFVGQDVVQAHAPPEVARVLAPGALGAALGAWSSQGKADSGTVTLAGARAAFGVLADASRAPRVGFAIIRAEARMPSVTEQLLTASRSHLGQLPFGWLLLWVVLLAGVGMLFTWLEHDVALRRMAQRQAAMPAEEPVPVTSGADLTVPSLPSLVQSARSPDVVSSLAVVERAASILPEPEPDITAPTRTERPPESSGGARRGPPPPPPPRLTPVSVAKPIPAPPSDDERHRPLFEEYVAKKTACGESAQGLTFERFLAALAKNRDQIKQSHGATDVVFSVAMKDGRVTLKASPKRT